MSNHNVILLSSNPNGKFLEGVLATITPKPGTALIIDGSVAENAGRPTFKLFDSAGVVSGKGLPLGPVCILLEDSLRGIGVDTAYAAGDRVRVYVPEAGDEINLRFADAAGTVDIAAGSGALIQDTTGLFIQTTGSPDMVAAIMKEYYEGDTGEQLINCYWGGY